MSLRRQPQRVPPPLTFGDETLEGASLLGELPGEVALLLWKTARSVRLWAELPASERSDAFVPEAFERRVAKLRWLGLEPPLAEALETAALVLRGEVADPAAVAAACRSVAQWADRNAALATALELMQAGALVSPTDASLAHAVARLARRRAEYARAESWYREALTRARRGRDGRSVVWSYLGLGITYMLRGNFPAARHSYIRGLRAAKRHSLHEEAGMLYHELAVLAIRSSSSAEAMKLARASFAAYGPRHPRIPALAHDVAVFWVTRGYYEPALRVFLSIPADYGEPADRLARAAAVVRAAGAVGDRRTFGEAWRDATRLLRMSAAAQGAATALVAMARGAVSLADWDRAEETARQAYELARSRGEGEQILDAESVLESVRSGRSSEQRAAEEVRRAPRQIQKLAVDLMEGMPEAAANGA